MNGDKLTRPMNASAVKKYSVKNKKLNKSQILKSGLDKNERLGGLKTQKGRSRQKLETRTKMIILIDWRPERAIYAKVKDHDKVTASVRHNPLGASSY